MTVFRFFIFLCASLVAFLPIAALPGQSYKIMVNEDGIYAITPRLLEQAGADPETIDPGNFRMTNKGREVPVYVSGESDGTFDEGDSVEFYGQRHDDGEYTSMNIYWLSWDERKTYLKPGARVVEEGVSLLETDPEKYRIPEQGYRQRIHFELDNGRFQRYNPDGDTIWFWTRLNTPGFSQIPFELQEVSDSLESGSIRVMLHGSANVKHNMEVFLNAGFRLGDITGYGQSGYLLEKGDIPNYIFSEGGNAIGIYYPPDQEQSKTEQVLLDWVEVEYWRNYTARQDLLEFSNPQNQEFGLYQFEIEGFSDPDIQLFKLSPDSSAHGVSKLTGGYVAERRGKYDLIFQDNVVQATRYIALSSHQVKSPQNIKADIPSFLRSVDQGADYIVITHGDFYESASILSRFRSTQGLRTMVVDVEDIYDEFSYGIFDPGAVRDFIQYAYHNWQKPAPTYVLLMGDASWWYKRDESYVPSYTYNSKVGDPGREWGPAASDDYFVCVSGDDPLPDLFIGRIPAKTDEEARSAVEKIIEYETSSEPGEWRRSLLFLSGRQPDEPQFIFEQKAEEFIKSYIPSGYDVSRICVNPDSSYFGGTSDLLSAINEGCSFIRFAGHGGGSVWSDDDLMTLEDIPLLENSGKLPFIVSWTCFTSWFDNPYANCMAEDLILLENGGAVAFFGSTGLGMLYADLYFEEEMYKVLFVKNERILGRAIAEAKASFLTRFAGKRDYVDLAATYVLMGDPATRLILPRTDLDVPARPDLMISPTHVLVTPHDADYSISVTVYNIGSADARDVTLGLYNSNPLLTKAARVASHQMALVPAGGSVTVTLNCAASEHADSIFVWIDPSDEIFEGSESNNFAQASVSANMSLVTPESGSNGPRTSSDGFFSCEIPTGIVPSQMYLKVAKADTSSIPDLQPDISYAPLPDRSKGVYVTNLFSGIPAAGNSLFEKGGWGDLKKDHSVPIHISFRYDPGLLEGDEQDRLAIYWRADAVERWVICDTIDRISFTNDHSVSADVWQMGTYALMINNDEILPEINLTLKDQGFINEDFASATPHISILAEDANGIKDVRVLLNGAPAQPGELWVIGLTGSTPFPVEYRPTLRRGRHTVEVEAWDLNGLSATGSLVVTVETEFRIEDIANRPNPCSRKTLFTYVLTQPADEMTIKIYTASGRLIRALDAPAFAGYNELLWDLRDEDGRAIANGAYFYKLSARYEGKKVEEIGKLAVLK